MDPSLLKFLRSGLEIRFKKSNLKQSHLPVLILIRLLFLVEM
ncbi:unnamed protein product [Brassica oleracea]